MIIVSVSLPREALGNDLCSPVRPGWQGGDHLGASYREGNSCSRAIEEISKTPVVFRLEVIFGPRKADYGFSRVRVPRVITPASEDNCTNFVRPVDFPE
jgi:hypothetical protein